MYSTLQRIEAQLATEPNSARRSSSLRTLVTHFSHPQLASMDPFGFETWPSFRPENYAYDISPRLFCYSFRILETQLVNTTVVAHDVVVAGNLNCWMRLQVRVHVALGQHYFGSPVGQIPDQLFNLIGSVTCRKSWSHCWMTYSLSIRTRSWMTWKLRLVSTMTKMRQTERKAS
jgi:hypothetical protein